MTEMKPLHVLAESKFIVIDEDTRAAYADYLLAGYLRTFKSTGSDNPHLPQIHLFLFIAPDCFYNHLLRIIERDNLKIHDYFTTDTHDLSKDFEVDLNSILTDNTVKDNSIVIINCLSSLILTVGLARATRFIEKLSARVGQLICLFNKDICVEKFPSIETLGTTYIQLNRCQTSVINNDIVYEASITHRKKGGSVSKKSFLAVQDVVTYEMKFEKLPVVIPKIQASTPDPVMKPQASFRTEMNARELEQRNQTPLPYILNSDVSNESKILYVPDDVDDFDEEDPDDDLPF